VRAVWEVLDGASVSEVARRFKVSRQSVHTWLRRYAADQGLGDRSSRPHGCPHQMSPVIEAKIVEVRRAHPGWGADRISYQLGRDGIGPVPGRSSIYRALLRNGLVVPGQRTRRRSDYRRWERARPMELWQMDVVGGFHLADGTELKRCPASTTPPGSGSPPSWCGGRLPGRCVRRCWRRCAGMGFRIRF
jgi:transposase